MEKRNCPTHETHTSLYPVFGRVTAKPLVYLLQKSRQAGLCSPVQSAGLNFRVNYSFEFSLLPSSDTEAEEAHGERAEPLGAKAEEEQRKFTVCHGSVTLR